MRRKRKKGILSQTQLGERVYLLFSNIYICTEKSSNWIFPIQFEVNCLLQAGGRRSINSFSLSSVIYHWVRCAYIPRACIVHSITWLNGRNYWLSVETKITPPWRVVRSIIVSWCDGTTDKFVMNPSTIAKYLMNLKLDVKFLLLILALVRWVSQCSLPLCSLICWSNFHSL